jgi:hypothetical protein
MAQISGIYFPVIFIKNPLYSTYDSTYLVESRRVHLLLLCTVWLSKRIYILYTLCIKSIYLTRDKYFLFIVDKNTYVKQQHI